MQKRNKILFKYFWVRKINEREGCNKNVLAGKLKKNNQGGGVYYRSKSRIFQILRNSFENLNQITINLISNIFTIYRNVLNLGFGGNQNFEER